MFGSRRQTRPPNPPLTAATADPNAATAAAAVFKRHDPNSTLSAAAAAAALRARPMTPTRVADVQTKRTLRRSASVTTSSSRTASPIIQGRPNLQRRGSSGSMTERTFRSPSPHSGGHRQTQSDSYDAPPVPALPKDIAASPQTQHRKSKSLGIGSTPMRLASQRLGSEDAPSWFGAAKVGDPANIRRTDPAMASPPSSPAQIPQQEQEAVSEIPRPDSQASSINFSYPTRTRVGSPPVSPTEGPVSVGSPARFSLSASPVEVRSPAQMPRAKEQPVRQALVTSPRPRSASNSPSNEIMVYDPNSRRMVPRSDLYPAQHEAPQQRANSKRKKKTSQKAGSHLAAGTVGRAKSTSSTSSPVAKNQAQATSAQVEERVSAPQSPAYVQEDLEEPSVKAIISSPRLNAKRLEQHGPPHTASPTIQPTKEPAWQGVRRQPSVVKEEPEPEESEHNPSSRDYLSQALDSVPTRQNVVLESSLESKSSSISQALDAVPTRQKVHTNTDLEVPSVEISKPASPSSVRDTRSPVDTRRVHVAHERSHSNSPVRQAHFGPVQENLMVKHSPPPRSISPRKSALKHSSPSRGASPSSSEASASANHELPIGRKKSVRVSFDDGKDVGSTSPEARSMSLLSASSPETGRQRWFSLVKKDIPSLDDEEIMKPRPALPSFGSVRERKPRDVQPEEDTERPLVRPNPDTSHNSTGSSAAALLPSPPLGSSNDHALGGIFSHEYDERRAHAANASRFKEPLPPVVTSVEGSGYISDTGSDSSLATTQSEYEPAEVSARDFAHQQPPKTQYEHSNGSTGPPNATAAAQQLPIDPTTQPEVPHISLIQPTPPALAENKSLKEVFFDVAGGFPENESDQSVVQQAAPAPLEAPKNLPPVQPSTQTASPTTHDTTDSESSIYSDAYEDLSDIEGIGFLSLDAVVESPLRPDPGSRQLATEAKPAQSHAEITPNIRSEMSTATTAVESPSAESPQDEWEKAKAYWRSLSADKRAQLEREAQEEAGVEADLDQQVQPEPKPKRKKSIERRNSERKALALHMAQQMAAQQQKEQEQAAVANPERSYMIKPGTKWTEDEVAIPTTMRKTLRNEPQQQSAPPHGPRLRKSLRSSSADTRRSDARPVDTSPAGRSVPSAAAAASSASTGSQRWAAAALPASTVPTTLRRRDSSGSESSFKRSRPQREAGTGFRMSMRPNSPPTDRSSKRFSITSLSSKQSVEAPAPSTQMRRTLRDSSTEGRKSPTGMRMPSLGKKSGAKVTKNKATGKFSSRFADSSDEDGGVDGFQSRFEDSSDDDDVMPAPRPLPKSRSAPNAVGSGRGHQHSGSIASTALLEELEESEETPDVKTNGANEPAISSPATQPDLAVNTSLHRVRSGRVSILPTSQTAPVLGTDAASPASGAASPDSKRATRRNSLMSVLRRKKHDSSSGGISRSTVTDSPARRDTKLERNANQLRATKDEDVSPIAEEPPVVEAQTEPEPLVIRTPPPQRSPKLRKRMGIFGHGHSQSVQQPPLLMKMQMLQDEDGGPKRPSTGGNLGTRTLSGGSGVGTGDCSAGTGLMQQRTAFSTGAPSVDGSSVTGTADGGTPKKKRFRGLRRMFRLDE